VVKAGDVTGLGDGFEGKAVVESTKQVSAVANTNWPTKNRSGSYGGFTAGSGTVYMPFIPFYPSVIEWEVSLYNVGTTNTTVDLTFYNTEGGLDHTESNIAIDAGKQAIKDSSIKDWTTTTYYNTRGAVPYWYGTMVATTADPANDRIAAVVTVHFGQESLQFQGVPSENLGTKVYMPYLVRNKANHHVSQPAIYNLSSAAEEVTVRFYNESDKSMAMEHKETIPADGMASLFLKSSTFDALGANWTGSAIVTSNSNVAVVVDDNRKFSPWGGTYPNWRSRMAYAAGPSGMGTTECFIPTAKRIPVGGSLTDFQWSEIAIFNVGTGEATYSVEYYDRDGTKRNGNWPLGPTDDPFKDLKLAADKAELLDGTAGKTMGKTYLGNNWEGGIRITSSESLNCVGLFGSFNLNTLGAEWMDLHEAQGQ
jgi:hypothetical protein